MPCPTCDCTLAKLDVSNARTLYWCSRCGTLVEQTPGLEMVQPPALVGRCRKFENAVRAGIGRPDDWNTLGIAESINRPEDRR